MEDWYYRVYYNDTYGAFVRRKDAYECYRLMNGYKIETVSKDLFPTIVTIVDGAGFNLERIREDLSIKKTTEAQRKAINRYDKANTKQIALKLNKNTDCDILAYLEQEENKQGFIKEAIRKSIKEASRKKK